MKTIWLKKSQITASFDEIETIGIYSIGISERQVEEQKNEYGEEDFYVVADDAMYYSYLFHELLDSLKVPVERPTSRFLKFKGKEDYIVDLEKEGTDGLYWSFVAFNWQDPPVIFNDVILEDASGLLTYLEEGNRELATQPLSCRYEEKTRSIGIGLAHFRTAEFDVYNDQALTSLFWSGNMYELNRAKTKGCPKYFKPDYGVMEFVCLEEHEEYLKIIINDSTVKYMPNNENTRLRTWETFIKSAVGLRRSRHDVSILPEENPFRTQPSESAPLLRLSDGSEPTGSNDSISVCGVKVDGEWLQVEIRCKLFCKDPGNENCELKERGWIRWRIGNEIIIEISTLT